MNRNRHFRIKQLEHQDSKGVKYDIAEVPEGEIDDGIPLTIEQWEAKHCRGQRREH